MPYSYGCLSHDGGRSQQQSILVLKTAGRLPAHVLLGDPDIACVVHEFFLHFSQTIRVNNPRLSGFQW